MKYLSSSGLLCHSCGSDRTEKNVLSFLQTHVLHNNACIWWCQELHEVLSSSECKNVKIICIWFQCSSVFLEDIYGTLITSFWNAWFSGPFWNLSFVCIPQIQRRQNRGRDCKDFYLCGLYLRGFELEWQLCLLTKHLLNGTCSHSFLHRVLGEIAHEQT